MAQVSPIIQNGILTDLRDGSPVQIVVDSPDWYDWLQTASTFTFRGEEGLFTAHKERAGNRRGRAYWRAYRTWHGKLHRVYLGQSEELTLERLQSVAVVLANKGAGEGSLDVPGLGAGTRSSAEASSKARTHRRRVTGAQGPHEAARSQPWFSSLPMPLMALIGREQEVRAIGDLLLHPEVRLLTLTGTPGVGKTRLALQVATDLQSGFVDGVFFIALASLRDPDLVVPTIAHALGLTETGDWPLLERLYASLDEKQVLLVLDNFEQVATAAPHLSELLVACPRIKLLVTSRAVLHIGEEYEYAVPPLAVPDLQHLPQLSEPEKLLPSAAVALFLRRARAIKPAFQLTPANAGAIAEICVRLDGLPLAIELAAARINLLSPRALLERLSHRLAVLTSTSQDMPARQQTLRSTLTWSYDLLRTEVQQLFGYLSVFVGGCTLEAVEAVCGTSDDPSTLSGFPILDGVASLVDTSLLNAVEQEDQEIRFTMLETIREYGLEVLETSGKIEDTRLAHATYYLRLAEEAEPQLSGPQQISWFQRLEREHDNLRTALSWFLEQGPHSQSRELALRLSGALWRFWEIRGYAGEGRRWLERALEISRGVRSAMQAKALISAGGLATLQDDFGQAEVLCREGLALYRELGDRQGSATALSIWGYASMMRSNYAEALALEEEALALFQEGGETGGRVFALQNLMLVLFYQGEYAKAHPLLEESLEFSREGGDIRGYAISLLLMGIVLLSEGNPARAHERLEESLAVSREMGYKWNIATTIHFLGLVTFLQGDATTAHSLLEESLVRFQEVGDRGSMAQIFFSQGFISFGQGEYAEARKLMEQSLEIARELERKWDMASYLEGLAAVVAAQGEPVRAVWFMSAAQARREAIGTPLQLLLQAMHEFTLASVRRQLGEQAFDAAWAEGRSMTPGYILAVEGAVTIPTAAPAGSSSIPYAPKASTIPSGLTAREVEVLRLLTQGLTSAQIAEQLIIGVVTVNFHVRSIYSKLGVSSRSAATRYAIEHKLV